jgi:hypothetical protein
MSNLILTGQLHFLSFTPLFSSQQKPRLSAGIQRAEYCVIAEFRKRIERGLKESCVRLSFPLTLSLSVCLSVCLSHTVVWLRSQNEILVGTHSYARLFLSLSLLFFVSVSFPNSMPLFLTDSVLSLLLFFSSPLNSLLGTAREQWLTALRNGGGKRTHPISLSLSLSLSQPTL